MLIGYARSLPDDKDCTAQIKALTGFGVRQEDIQVDRTKTELKNQPALKKILSKAAKGTKVVVWSLNALAGKADSLIRIMHKIVVDKGAHIQSLAESLDTSATKNMISVEALSKFRDEAIREKLIAGQKQSRIHGRLPGRASGFSPEDEKEIHKMVAAGEPISYIASKYKVARSTIYALIQRTAHKK